MRSRTLVAAGLAAAALVMARPSSAALLGPFTATGPGTVSVSPTGAASAFAFDYAENGPQV
jgi:hypothetical protein